MATYSDTEYEIDLYRWDAQNQVRFYIKTITSFENLEIIDYADQIDTGNVTVAESDWDTDTQSVRVIEKQSNNDIYRGRVNETTKVGTSLEVETTGTFTGAEGLVGDVEYSLYVGATVESAPEFQEKIINFSDLSVNQTAGSMSDWSATVPPQPRLEEYGFNRVTVWNEENDTAFFVGVLEEIETDPQESTSISGRGVLVEEDYNSTSVTYSSIDVVDAIQDFANNYLQFDWSFVGTNNVNATIGSGGKTFTGTHYEIFRDLHNLASLDFNLVYNDWNDVDLQTFKVGEPSPNQENITIKDYSRGYDYTDYANKVTLVGSGGLTATAEDVSEQNDFGKTIHRTVRKPRLETQTEVDNAVDEALNKAVNNRNQSGDMTVVPTSVDVGFDYTFNVFQNFFLNGNYVTQGYAELPDKSSNMVPRRQHIPTDGNDSLVELLIYPEIKTLGQNEYANIISGYEAPDYLRVYGDGSLGVKANAMDSEERTEAGLVEHQTTSRVSVLIWNDIFAGSGNVHYGGIWIDGGDENNPDLGFFNAGDNIFIDFDGNDTTRLHSRVPLRIGTNHPIKEFSDSLDFHYPIESMSSTAQDLLDNHSTGTTGEMSGSASSLVEDTPKGQAVSLDVDSDGYSIASTDESFGDLGIEGFTFIAFVNIDNLGTGVNGDTEEFRTLYGNGPTPEDGVTSDTGHSFVLSDNGVEVHWYSDDHLNADGYSSVYNPTVGEWAQVGVQFHYDAETPLNSEIRIILNGEIVDTTPWTEPDGDYTNLQKFSLLDASGIETTNTYQFFGDVADIRLLDGDVSASEIRAIYDYQQNVNGFVGGIDDIRFWSDNESYSNFTDISNGYHLVPSGEINDEPIVPATGETPLQTILNIPYREVDASWDGAGLINQILRGYVTMESVFEPDFDFGHDEGSRENDSNYTFDSYNISIPTTNTRVEEAQYTLGMDGGDLKLNLDISNRIDTILSESRTEIEDTKQVL